MADWNPGSPDTIGLQTFFTQQGEALLAGGAAAAVRLSSSAAQTIDTLSAFLVGATEDPVTLLAEVYESGDEVLADTDVTTTRFRPTDDLKIGGNDSESTKWISSSLTTTDLYTFIDEATLTVSDYLIYFGTAAQRKRYRFCVDTGGSDWPASRRVVGGRVKLVARREQMNGRLEVSYFDGSNTYRLGTVTVTKGRQTLSVPWPEYNPATRLPWTRAEIQALDSGGGSAIQLRPVNINKQKRLFVYQAWLELDWVTENRVAVGRAVVDSGDVGAGAWVPITLSHPNTGADNWSKAAATDYTVVLRSIGGLGRVGWRHLGESAEVAAALGRGAAGEALPVLSYVPTLDPRGFVADLRDAVAGRAMALVMTTTGAAQSVDSQPYAALVAEQVVRSTVGSTAETQSLTTDDAGLFDRVRAVLAVPRGAGGLANLGSFNPPATGSQPGTDLAFGTWSVTLNGVAFNGTTHDVTQLDQVSPLPPVSDDLTDAGVELVWALVDLTTKVGGVPLSATTTYDLDFIVASGLDPSLDNRIGVLVADTMGAGGGATAGGATDDYENDDDRDAIALISAVPAALTDFSATAEPVATAADGDCTVSHIDRVRVQWGQSVEADFARYEVERQNPDGTWSLILTTTDPDQTLLYDYEARLGVTETYRARQVRSGDLTPSAWTGEDTATASLYGYETKIASNHAQDAVAYERGPDHQWGPDREIEVVGISGADGRYAFTHAENRGDDLTLPLIVASDPDTPGRSAFDPLRQFLRAEVPHFAICDADGDRVYGAATLVGYRRTEPEAAYTAEVEVAETQFAPTPT